MDELEIERKIQEGGYVNWKPIFEYQKLSEQFIEKFKDNVDWKSISEYQKLSEQFIEKFKGHVNWYYISIYQKLSEDFIEKFKDLVNWDCISIYQKLSEDFIEKFKDHVNWYYISKYQKLSEDFIEKLKDQVNWYCISRNQKLSEQFIEKFKGHVNWYCISINQKLSEQFILTHSDKVNISIQYKKHKEKTIEQKIKEITEYAKKHNLKFDGTFLYAYRNHDMLGRGMFNNTIYYERGIYYKDWHCDMDKTEENSFGFGIWPEGNTQIKVRVEDWGVAVNRGDGKARVWGFEII